MKVAIMQWNQIKFARLQNYVASSSVILSCVMLDTEGGENKLQVQLNMII